MSAEGLSAMISTMSSASVENAKERLALAARRLPDLRAAANEAAAVGAEMRSAFAEERGAAEALLRAAVEVAKPALPLICTPEKFFFSVESVSVAHLASFDMKDPAKRFQLYVCPNGSLAESIHVFEENYWAMIEWHPIDFFTAVGRSVVRYDVEKVVATLLRLCAEAAGGNGPKRAAEARRRAERLRAVATLIDAAGGAK